MTPPPPGSSDAGLPPTTALVQERPPASGRARPGTGHLPPLPAREARARRGDPAAPFPWLPWVLLTALLLGIALMLAIAAAVSDDDGAAPAGRAASPHLPTTSIPWS